MSSIAQAEALLADMLSAGPRSAAEILAAGQGANLSERTTQRAGEALGVVKSKDGHGGWTWRLPTPEEPRQQVEQPERAAVIARRLRDLEQRRGKAAPIYSADPRLRRWVAAGISDPELREAYDRAVFALRGDNPVTVGHLDGFVAEVMAEAAVQRKKMST